MKFARVGLSSFIAVLDAFAWKGSCTMREAMNFTGLSRPSVRSSVNNGWELRLLTSIGDAADMHYSLTEKFGRHLTGDSKKAVIREHLQQLPLFQQLCIFLKKTENTEQAVRQTLALFGLPGSAKDDAKNLLSLATDVGILRRQGCNYSVSQGLTVAAQDYGISSAALDSEMAAILFLGDRLTPEILNSLETPEQDRLIKALILHASDPEKSCENAGMALENYLRVVGLRSGDDLSGCSGLGQAADFLAARSRFIIHPKHRDIAAAISAIRNCSAHDRDRLTNRTWVKSPQTALINVLLVLQLIRSIYVWTSNKAQLI